MVPPDCNDAWISGLLLAETRVLVGWLVLLTGSREVADELFQDVCLEAWRVRARFRPDADFGAWVRGIARNVVMREWRRRGRRRAQPWSPEVMNAMAVTWDRTQEQETADERAGALTACLDQLDPGHRSLLRTIYFDGVSHASVAADAGRTPEAMKMLVYRLRNKLRECIRRRLRQEEIDVR
jgi:RNA polymerase sigma-70 factor (ECF subfamily)